jgi:hypothetical protein
LLLPLLPGAATAAVTGAAKDANELTEMLAIFLPFRSNYCCDRSTEMAMAEQKRRNAAKQNAALSATKNTNTKRTGLVCVDRQSRG